MNQIPLPLIFLGIIIIIIMVVYFVCEYDRDRKRHRAEYTVNIDQDDEYVTTYDVTIYQSNTRVFRKSYYHKDIAIKEALRFMDHDYQYSSIPFHGKGDTLSRKKHIL